MQIKELKAGMMVYVTDGWTSYGCFKVLDIDPIFEKRMNPHTTVYQQYWAYARLSYGEWVRVDSLQPKDSWEQHWEQVSKDLHLAMCRGINQDYPRKRQ